MAEHVLRGEIVIYPRAEGGRQFLINDTQEIYRIPLPEEALEKVVRELSMTDEELMAELQRRQAAAKLAVSEEQMNGQARILQP